MTTYILGYLTTLIKNDLLRCDFVAIQFKTHSLGEVTKDTCDLSAKETVLFAFCVTIGDRGFHLIGPF